VIFFLACTAPVPDSSPAQLSDTIQDETSQIEPSEIPDSHPPQGLVLNEIQARNDSTIMDAALAFNDWIELYNSGDEEIALNRVTISDESGQSWRGPAETLKPSEWRLLWSNEGGLPFGINNDGDQLELAIDGVVIDRIATGMVDGDTSWARYPDGGSWAYTARPTPGYTNGSNPGESTDPSDQLFGVDTVHDLHIWLSDDSWAALNDDHYTDVEASLAFRGAWFDRVGFAKKSTVGSNRDFDGKAAFKIDLDEYDENRLRGKQKLVLNNMVQDPTYVAEYLSYQVFRTAGVPAPRVGYVRLYINDEDWGLYALVEAIDKDFLARWFSDNSGDLYEGAYGIDLESGELDDFEHDEGNSTELTNLEAVVTVLDAGATEENLSELRTHIDMDQFITNMAVEVNLLHWDGYTTANNYRLYHNPDDDLFSIIPWGTDQTFIDNWYGLYSGYGRLMTFCMAIPSCVADYETAVLDVADIIDSLALDASMDAARAALAEDIASDPRAEHSETTQDDYLTTMRNTILTWPSSLQESLQ